MAATSITRSNALLSMTSSLGPDVLTPAAMELEEALSEPFICAVDVVSARDQIDPDDLLHRPVCLTLN